MDIILTVFYNYDKYSTVSIVYVKCHSTIIPYINLLKSIAYYLFLLCAIFQILEVTDHFITSQFAGKVADNVTGNNIAQVSIRKLYGWDVTETTIEDSNFICCRGEALRKLQM